MLEKDLPLLHVPKGHHCLIGIRKNENPLGDRGKFLSCGTLGVKLFQCDIDLLVNLRSRTGQC